MKIQPQGHVTMPPQRWNSSAVTKMELITDTQLELICRHKDKTHHRHKGELICRHKNGTNLPSQRRNSSSSQRWVLRYQCHIDYSIQLGNHRVITRHGTRVKHKELTDYKNSKHSSFPSSFTKTFEVSNIFTRFLIFPKSFIVNKIFYQFPKYHKSR